MVSTKIGSREYLELKKKMDLKTEETKMSEQKRIKNVPFLITNSNEKRNLYGSPRHQNVGNYIINILKKHNFDFKTEVGVYLKDIKKQYTLDILAYKRNSNKKIAIECGNVTKRKLKDLKNYFNVIHLSYKNYRILNSAKKIKQDIFETINKLIWEGKNESNNKM